MDVLGRQGKGHSAHYLDLVTQADNPGVQMWKQQDCHKFLVSLSYTISGQPWGCIVRRLSKQKNKQTKQSKGAGGEKEEEQERENPAHKDLLQATDVVSGFFCPQISAE